MGLHVCTSEKTSFVQSNVANDDFSLVKFEFIALDADWLYNNFLSNVLYSIGLEDIAYLLCLLQTLYTLCMQLFNFNKRIMDSKSYYYD